MKKLAVIFLLICSTSSFAQSYFPFPDSVGVWKQTSSFYQPTGQSDTHYNIFMNGDTIIDGASYNKLYIYSCGQITIFPPSPIPIFDCPIDTSNSLYYGAIREMNKRIYFFPDSVYNYSHNYSFCFTINSTQNQFNEEIILYDFNATSGDTILYPHLDSLKMVINSIDSVLIQSNFRKRYNYYLIQSNSSSQCNPFGVGYNYVEGIGDINSGLFSLFMFYFENAEYLNCFEDDEVNFSNNGGCVTNYLNELSNDSNLKIYPNPSSSKLFIELENPAQGTISLFDISGKEIYSTNINQTRTTIDVSSFKRGLYLIKVSQDKGLIKTSIISIN